MKRISGRYYISVMLFLFVSCLLCSCYSKRARLAKLNDISTWQRIKFFDGNDYSWLDSAYKVSDGYMIVGTDNGKGLLIKTDDDGIKQWIKHYSYTTHEEFYCVKEINDGYIIVGMTSGVSENNGLLVKIDSSGHEDWHKIFEGKCNRLYGIDKTNNGYILAGSTDGN